MRSAAFWVASGLSMLGNISLYVMAFTFPRIINFLFAARIQLRNSLNKEKGGLVIIMSDSSRNLRPLGIRSGNQFLYHKTI